MRTRYRAPSTTPVVHACFRVSIRNLRKFMACFLPFRPWLSPDPRVFRFRTTRDQSTDPTHVLSCTCAPPQWLAPTRVTLRQRLGRPCPRRKVPRMYPRPFSIPRPRNPFLRPAFEAKRSNGLAAPSESPTSRVWLPSWRCQLLDPRKPVSAPHAHGLHSSGLRSDLAAELRFPRVCPLVRFSVKPNGLIPALQRLSLATSAAPTGSPTLFG